MRIGFLGPSNGLSIAQFKKTREILSRLNKTEKDISLVMMDNYQSCYEFTELAKQIRQFKLNNLASRDQYRFIDSVDIAIACLASNSHKSREYIIGQQAKKRNKCVIFVGVGGEDRI